MARVSGSLLSTNAPPAFAADHSAPHVALLACTLLCLRARLHIYASHARLRARLPARSPARSSAHVFAFGRLCGPTPAWSHARDRLRVVMSGAGCGVLSVTSLRASTRMTWIAAQIAVQIAAQFAAQITTDIAAHIAAQITA